MTAKLGFSLTKTLAPYFALACLPAVAGDLAPTAPFRNRNPVQGALDPKTGETSGPVADIAKELDRRAGAPNTGVHIS